MSPAARMAVFLVVFLSIWLAEHLYVGWRLFSLPVLESLVARRVLVAVMVFGYAAYLAGRFAGNAGWRQIAAGLEYAGGLWMGVIFLFLAAFLVVDLVTIGGFAFKSVVPALRNAAAIAALLATAAAWFGGWVLPRVVTLEVESRALPPALDGTTVVQVSDVHVGAVTSARRLNRLVDLIQGLEPDVIAVTGDLVDGDIKAVEPMVPVLSRLRAPKGVFAVLGNHEYYAGPDRSREIFRRCGYTVLDNHSVEVAPGLIVAGVPDARGASQTGRNSADLGATLLGVDPQHTIILLQHSPGDEAEAAAAGVDLMLNGHTHGGQIWPFTLLVARAYPHYAGARTVGDMTQMVSRGAGLWGPPMRLFAPADIVHITLRAARDGDSDPEAGRVLPPELPNAKVPPAPT